jgi:hypothetical protein
MIKAVIMMIQVVSFVVLLLSLPNYVHSFSPRLSTKIRINQCPNQIQQQQQQENRQSFFNHELYQVSKDNNNIDHTTIQQSRQEFLSKMIFGVVSVVGVTSLPPPAFAADDNVKGTKKDPVYEACLSQCMYDCTKPKGYEQKSRMECLPECKKSCAKTPEQLLLGTPIKK